MTSTRREYTINGNIVRVSIRPCSKTDPVLIADYQIPGGKRQRPRLGTSDIDAAVLQVETIVEDPEFRAYFPRRTDSGNGTEDLDPTLSRVIDYYLDTALVISGKTALTRTQYRTRLTLFLEFCSSRNVGRVSQLNREIIDQYSSHLIEQGGAPKTVKDKLGVIRSCLNAAVDADIIDHSPIRKWLVPNVPDPEIDFLKPGELKYLLQAIKMYEPDFFGILSWMAGSGNRPSDSRALRMRQVDLENRVVRRTQVKSNRLAKYEIGDLCVNAVRCEMGKRGIGPDDLIFVNENGGQYDNRAIVRSLDRAIKASNFPRRVTPKVFRHTYANTMANIIKPPMPLEKLRIQMGHANISTTLEYVHNTEGGESIRQYESLIT